MDSENSIAAELMSIILVHSYRRYIQCIWSRDALQLEDFNTKPISTSHWIDTRNSYTGSLINSGFMYELFGAFSEEDPVTVRTVMLNLIKAEYELYSTVGRVVLNVRGCDLDTWLEEMDSNITILDELMLYALSRAYNRHTFVLCKD